MLHPPSTTRRNGSAGVVAALPAEYRAIPRCPGLLPCLSGMGAGRAAEAARRLLGDGAAALISWGTAAALAPQLRAGDLLLPERIRCAEGGLLEVSPGWREALERSLAGTLPIHGRTLLELAEPVVSAAEKSVLHLQTGAVAGDMESAAVAREALAAGVPFLALRVVVDAASLSLPACLLPALDGAGRTRMTVLLAGLLRSPRDLRPLMALGLGYRRALGTLRRAGRVAGGLLTSAQVSSC